MRKMFTAGGERLYRVVRVKIFAPGNSGVQRLNFNAEPGNGFTAQGIEDVLAAVAKRIETELYPGHEYSLVETGIAAEPAAV